MGFFESLSDLFEAATPWSAIEAEAPKEEEEKVRSASFCLRWDGMGWERIY